MTNEELVAEIQKGKTEYIDPLWEQCYWFIYKQALRWAKAWEKRVICDLDDFVQSGYFALCEAVKSYVPERGSFIGYLAFFLKTEFSKVAGCYTATQVNEPLNNAVSLNEPFGDEDASKTLEDTVSDPHDVIEDVEEKVFREQLSRCVYNALDRIPQKQHEAVGSSYLNGKTYNEIAEDFGCSLSYVGQLVKSGLKSLRKDENIKEMWNILYGERNLHKHTGLASFRQTGCSVQEHELICIENMTEKYF